jgi:predicted kinase
MVLNKHCILATIGHTAAGKTTLSKFLIGALNTTNYNIEYIKEGKIKRDIIGSYSTKDSLNEELRDIAYKKAIDIASDIVHINNVLIDASFHKLSRRQMLYRAIINNDVHVDLIWLYCYCPNIEKVGKRIAMRKTMRKAEDNQADSMDIYYHIVDTFDMPCINELPDSINGAIIYLNTDSNVIDNIMVNSPLAEFSKFIESIVSYIEQQQHEWKNIEC